MAGRWGQLRVGRIDLAETYELDYAVNATSGVQTVTLTGSESSPPLTLEAIRMRQEDLAALLGIDLPVTFSDKTNHNGFYRVSDAGTHVTSWRDHAEGFSWNLTLTRLGPDNAVDVESRMGPGARTNAFALSPVLWHAPGYGSAAYHSPGTALLVNRTLADGAGVLPVYSLAAGVQPLWAASLPQIWSGRVAFRTSGIERTGTGNRVSAPTGWTLDNGLIRVTPRAGGITLEGYRSTNGWDPINLDISIGANAWAWSDVSLLRNDFACVTLRAVSVVSPSDPTRAILDILLRRGARTIECRLQSDTSATLTVASNPTVTTTNNAATGYIVASSDSANGNRYTAGSATTFTGSTTGAISKAASTTLNWYSGWVINGSAPATNDGATNLRDQYLGSVPSRDVVVQR